MDKLKTASQSEVLNAFKESEDERARHQAYLDQLLLLVIERCPELLNTMSANPDATRYMYGSYKELLHTYSAIQY